MVCLDSQLSFEGLAVADQLGWLEYDQVASTAMLGEGHLRDQRS